MEKRPDSLPEQQSPAGAACRRAAALLSAAVLPFLSSCRDAGLSVQPAESSRGEGAHVLSTGMTVPSSFEASVLAAGLAYPTSMAVAPDGRIFVCEQGGRLRVVRDGTLLAAPFLTVPVSSGGERGLLGVALDPQFAANRHVYVYYTTSQAPVRNRVSRFAASASNPDVAAPGSETILLDLDPVGAGNHNGGALRFGPDGMLYIAVGENAVPSNSQSLGNLLGKILRIRKDGGIPEDNPFYGTASGKNRAIWALGLRNPFSFDIQPGTGRMFVNDVGWDTWEEINEGAAGANYGWPAVEGPSQDARFRAPFHAYANAGGNCAIVGAAFYNPANPANAFPAGYAGDYFFGDYCGGWIRRIDPATGEVSGFASGIQGLVDIRVGDDGALYYLAAGSGRLMRVVYSGGEGVPPSIVSHPASATVDVGGSATFSVSAMGTAPLSYQWQRDGADIPGADGSSYTLIGIAAGDDGARFRAVVGNSLGTAVSGEAVLTVSANRPPTGTILAPAEGSLYQGGQAIAFSGTASDPDQGELPPSAFTWSVDLHHDDHTHPFVQPVTGMRSGSFTAYAEGETSPNVFFRIHLVVADAEGAVHRLHRDIHPRRVEVTLATRPAGLLVRLDGTDYPSPHTFTGVVGVRRTLSAASPQAYGGAAYSFQSWSDGGAATHAVSTPSANTVYTATFARSVSGPNQPPRPAILAPAPGFLWQGGQTIGFSGSAPDPEQGELPDAALTWYVEIIHGMHTHPVLGPLAGVRSGSFTASAVGQADHATGLPDHDYWYRISLKATDEGGLTRWAYRDIMPRKATVTLSASPAGLRLRLDGAPVVTPHVFTGVAGVVRSLSAITPQDAGGRSWSFLSWSDGGAADHSVVTPAADSVITAVYQ